MTLGRDVCDKHKREFLRLRLGERDHTLTVVRSIIRHSHKMLRSGHSLKLSTAPACLNDSIHEGKRSITKVTFVIIFFRASISTRTGREYD
jgi:predicted translin family RNA/ssDNA-binding protein